MDDEVDGLVVEVVLSFVVGPDEADGDEAVEQVGEVSTGLQGLDEGLVVVVDLLVQVLDVEFRAVRTLSEDSANAVVFGHVEVDFSREEK